MSQILSRLALPLLTATALAVAVPGAVTPAAASTSAVRLVASDPTSLEELRATVTARIEATQYDVSRQSGAIAASDLTDDLKDGLTRDSDSTEQGLQTLLEHAQGATTVEQLRGDAQDLKHFNPKNYAAAVRILDAAAALARRVDGNDNALVGADDAYATAASTHNEAARANITSGADGALFVDANTSSARLVGLRGYLDQASAELRTVTQLLRLEQRFLSLHDRTLAEAQTKNEQLAQVQAKVASSSLTDDQKTGLGQAIEQTFEHTFFVLTVLPEANSLAAVQQLAGYVRDIYPHAFDVELSALVEAPRLQARVARNAAALAAITDRDVSVGVAANGAAAAAVASALSSAAQIKNNPTRAAADAVRRELTVAHQQLRIVRQVLAG